jgi:hypothetical protein
MHRLSAEFKSVRLAGRRNCKVGSWLRSTAICVSRTVVRRSAPFAQRTRKVHEALGSKRFGAGLQVHPQLGTQRRHLFDRQAAGVAEDALELLAALAKRGARQVAQRALVLLRDARRVVRDVVML